MKTALVITYYWPPAGGVAVQRVLKFCKYLPAFGWRPVILTVQQGNFETSDHSVDGGGPAVYRARSFEPHGLYHLVSRLRMRRRTPARPASTGRTANVSLGEMIRLNLFVPDARLGWFPFAWRLGLEALREEKPAVILSSAPPFTTHLVARRLAHMSGLPWVADFRDPWVENTLYNKVPRWPVAMAVNRRLEASVLRQADAISCVGERLRHLLLSKVPERAPGDFRVVANGYDAEDLTPLGEPFPRFVLAYFGSLYPHRFPQSLFQAIGELLQVDPGIRKDLRLRIHGHVTAGAREQLTRYMDPANLQVDEPLPYREYLKQLYRPQLLLLSIDRVPHNDLILLGKTFDYLPTGNPVLGIGPPDGDAARLLRETAVGEVFDYDEVGRIKAFISTQYDAWRQGTLNRGVRQYPPYERKSLTGALARLLDELAARKLENHGSTGASRQPQRAPQ